METLFDFESGSLDSNWENKSYGFGVVSDQAYGSSYSVYANGSDEGPQVVGERTLTDTNLNSKPDWVQCYFRETSDSYGSAWDLVNSNGNVEIGAGTTNPAWVTWSANGINSFYSGDGYDRWIRSRIYFDWSNNEATVTHEDMSNGVTQSTNVSLRHGVDVVKLRIKNIDSTNNGWDSTNNNGSDSFELWFDSFTGTPQPPSAPQTVTASVNANDQITLNWDAPNDWGGEQGNYRVNINRDSASYVNPSGGPTTPGSGTTSATYGPNSDNSYNSQVGIDSSFRFRVRAENSAGNSGWTYSSWVYTDPIPPHNPSVTRPDDNTITVNWDNQSGIADNVILYVREDTGSGYGSWNWISTESATNGSVTYTIGTAYETTLQSDARYQFRLQSQESTANTRSEYVYADYGNSGNVYFEDDFESGDLSKWGGVYNGATDSQSGIQSGSFSDLGISGADQGTYYCRLDAGDDVRKSIGSISSDTNVIVRATVATGSMDSGGEQTYIEWYDGSTYQTLRTFSHEYNKQGWTQVTAVVPSSYLNSNNHIRFRGYGGGGDHFAVDHVVVSDILHEYTKPAAPSGLSLDASVNREISATWTLNASFSGDNSHFQEFRQRQSNSGNALSKTNVEESTSHTTTSLLDGEKYDIRVDALYTQFRHGETDGWWRSSTSLKTATTDLSTDGSVTALPESNTEVGLSWTATQNNGSRTIYYRQTGASSWTNHSSVSIGTEAVQITALNEDTEYEFKTNVSTDHISKDSSTDTATTFVVMARDVGSFTQPMSMTTERVISTSMSVESYSGVLSSSTGRATTYSREHGSYLNKIASSAEILVSYVRSGETFTDKMTSFTYTDHTSLEMIDYRVDWNNDEATWYTNWFQETRITGDEDNLALRPKVVDEAKEPAAKVQVQYDRNGDGIPDEETQIIDIGKAEDLHQIDDIPISESGQYRLKIMDYSGFNSLISIDFGIVH